MAEVGGSMPRLSITFTDANEAYMQELISKGEFSSKTEIVNAVVSEARRRDRAYNELMASLDEAAAGPFSDRTLDDILEGAIERHEQTKALPALGSG